MATQYVLTLKDDREIWMPRGLPWKDVEEMIDGDDFVLDEDNRRYDITRHDIAGIVELH